MTTSDTMRDFGEEAQRVAEAHLEACFDAMYAEEEGWQDAEQIASPASAPFCGCITCLVRETLWSAWTVVDAYVDDALKGPVGDDVA